MSRWGYMRRLRSPFKPEGKPDPEPKPPAPVDPRKVCPFCGNPTKQSSKILEGHVVLRCAPCARVAVLGSNRDEWVQDSDAQLVDRLARVAESIRVHREMVGSDPDDPRWEGIGW